MIKTLLVPLVGLDSDKIALDTALVAARLFDGHIQCLHTQPSVLGLVVKAIPTSGEVGMTAGRALADNWKALQKEARSRAEAVKEGFGQFCRKAGVTLAETPSVSLKVSAALLDVEGDEFQEVVRRARLHDLLVLGRAASSGHFSQESIGDLLISCGRPILLAPSKSPATLSAKVAIAWKDTQEAARAVSAAMPFLRKAKAVVILAASEGEASTAAAKSARELSESLAWHGVKADVRALRHGKKPAAESILAAAEAQGACLLIMGGYGHSRTREFIFGGVTRRILQDAPLTVFLSH